jgi:hypothetical protein
MAITLVSQPAVLDLTYKPLLFQVTSDNVAIDSIIVEVLWDSNRVAVKQVQPDLNTTDEFTFDVQEEIKKQLFFELKAIGSSGVIEDMSTDKAYKVKVYEVYTSGGLLVTNYDPSDNNNSSYDFQSSSRYVFNGILTHLEYNSWDITDYRLNSDTKKFLTDAPLNKTIELGENEFLGILYHDGNANKNFKLEVLTYNSSGSLLNTDYINVPEWDVNYIGNIIAGGYLDLSVGTSNLIAAGVSLTNVSYYTVQMINDDGDVSEIRRYDIVNSCDTDTRLHWVNRFGKQDSYTFKGNSTEYLEHKNNLYQKYLGNTYYSYARGYDNIQALSNNNFVVYTESIGRDTFLWLSDMLINKIAWVEIEDSYFPIIINDGTKLIRDEKGMPIQFVLDYSFANPNKGIRG